jgi:hypothetical protein
LAYLSKGEGVGVEKELVALVIGVDGSYHLSQIVNFVQENDHQ